MGIRLMIAIWNLFLNNTSNEYTLQVVYDTNGFYRKYHRIITSILAIYDTTVPPYSYTGSGNIDITDDQISLSFSLGVNGEVFLNTGNYDGAVFEMSSATEIFYLSTKHSSWWSTDRSILFIYKSMYISW